jgi:hypothetical protein
VSTLGARLWAQKANRAVSKEARPWMKTQTLGKLQKIAKRRKRREEI